MRIALAAALASFALLAGCGGDEDEPEPGGDGGTELGVTIEPEGRDGGVESVSVVCPGPDEDACAAVAALPDDVFAPVPPATACTEIFGGPDVLTITGTLDGEEVNAEMTRSNGCEIERFDRFAELLAVLFPDYEPGASLAP